MSFDEELNIKAERKETLRYGENPHQKAALYLDPTINRPCVARAKQIQGKELSFNNIADADAAFECVAEFEEPAVVIVKHMNPCGVAVGTNLVNAYTQALACDPVSAFGGIVAVNREVDADVAQEFTKLFLEVIIAPSVSPEAKQILAAKQNVRVLETGGMPDATKEETTVRSVACGFLVQTRDNAVIADTLQTVTKREPTGEEMADMKFAFTVCKHVKSNAIVYARGGATLGIGAGQMSRIYSARIAAIKAKDATLSLKGAVMASDAFMPFPDCVEAARDAGAIAIIQPGGSKNDQASIDAANEAAMTMVFTGMRHFRH
jgi:phosphoribosylaminoimidazolecarboxamide formyltransferase/IMP cyclohydrolase